MFQLTITTETELSFESARKCVEVIFVTGSGPAREDAVGAAYTLGREPTRLRRSVLNAKDDLITSRAAPAVCVIYRAFRGQRHWTIARLVCRLLLKLEGGPYHSATVRHLLRKDFGVSVGLYSYGDCLVPGAFPPQVEVGRYTSISEGARVYNQNHPIERLSTHPFFYEFDHAHGANLSRHALSIGHDVWIGRNAVVTPGCSRIGNGAIVGAGAVVTKNVEEFSIVAGVPARHIRYRFDESTRRSVAESEWWLESAETFARFPEVLATPAAELSASHHPILFERNQDTVRR